MANLLERRNMMMPISDAWLNKQTMQVLLTAFGADGPAVIKETKGYLSNIAVGDINNAYTLAGFINEDPMMVCNLGLEPQLAVLPAMPIRWILGDGNAKIYTGITNYDRIVLNVIFDSFPGCNVFGYGYADNGVTRRKNFSFNSSSYPTFGFGDGESGYYQTSGGWYLNTIYEIEAIFQANFYSELKQDGIRLYSGTASRTGEIECSVMGINNNNGLGTGGMKGKGREFVLYNGNDIVGHFVPFKRSGAMELLNFVSGTIATRVGTFTEYYTLPNGTPWTPS